MKIYSINFFYYFVEYEHDFFNWYYNNVPDFYLRKKKKKILEALRMTLNKIVQYLGHPVKWKETRQFQDAKYAVFYKTFKLKKYSKTGLKLTEKNLGVQRIALDDTEQLFDFLKYLRIKGKFLKKFRKNIKNKKPIDSWDIFCFLTLEIKKKHKMRRLNKKWKIKGFKCSILKR